MKPRFNRNCLHSLQGQFFGCHFLIALLKAFRLVSSFSYKGTISQIFGPRYKMLLGRIFFNLITVLEKKLQLKTFTVLSSPTIISSFSINVIFWVDVTFSDNKVLTVFQNVLLSLSCFFIKRTIIQIM